MKSIPFNDLFFTNSHFSGSGKGHRKRNQLPIGKEIDLTPASNATSIEAENTLTIIAVPTYAGRVAQTALDRLKIIKAHQSPAIIAVLYGNRDYEDALIELRDTVNELGFIPISGGTFIGEHSYSTSTMPTAPGRPDPSDLQIAKTLGRKSVEQLHIYGSASDIPLLEVKGNIPYKEKNPKLQPHRKP